MTARILAVAVGRSPPPQCLHACLCVIPQLDGEPVIVQYEARQFAIDMDGTLLRSGIAGCQVLGR
jgi:hypothetical protein